MFITPDLGRCDLCGSEEGDRWQDFLDGAWLCEKCMAAPRATQDEPGKEGA